MVLELQKEVVAAVADANRELDTADIVGFKEWKHFVDGAVGEPAVGVHHADDHRVFLVAGKGDVSADVVEAAVEGCAFAEAGVRQLPTNHVDLPAAGSPGEFSGAVG